MSTPKRYYGLNHLHDVTTSTYRRVRLLDAERFRNRWVATLAELRQELKSRIMVPPCGITPEHFHVLLRPQRRSFARHLPHATRHFFCWSWSTWRFYYLQDASLLRMDRLR